MTSLTRTGFLLTALLTASAAAALTGCTAAAPTVRDQERPTEPRVTFHTSEATKALGLPFSDAVRVGDMLYLSGAIGLRPGTLELVPGGIEAETRQTMENIRRVLEAYGSSMDRVVKCTVMMADMSEWPALNAIYVTYFDGHYPARSALGANGLALGARVEIECLATVGS